MKPEITNKKIIGKSPNTQRLNSTLLNKIWVKEVSRDILKYFELNENLWYGAKQYLLRYV